MIYTPQNYNDILAVIPYGSHLYGTNTATSDFDFKVITLPSYRALLLGKQLRVERFRYDKDGNPLKEDVSMPEGGYEAEHIPVQKLIKDFLSGQAYAVEFVHAIKCGFVQAVPADVENAEFLIQRQRSFTEFITNFENQCRHSNLYGMIGFAIKQTFDYVRRGERYTAAMNVLQAINDITLELGGATTKTRLDTPFGAHFIFDEIVARTSLEIGSTVNHDRVMRTIKLNGREYLETTVLSNFSDAVQKLAAQYGERSVKAAISEVEWKSLSHAVRVYQQVVELLFTGSIQFPRANAPELLHIRRGEMDLETVKEMLRDLDDAVVEALKDPPLPQTDANMHNVADEMLFNWINSCYRAEPPLPWV